MTIERAWNGGSFTLTTSAGTATAIDARAASTVALLVPTSGALFTYYASTSADGTYAVVGKIGSNSDGTDAVTTATWHVLPSELFAFGWIKVICDVAGSSGIQVKN